MFDPKADGLYTLDTQVDLGGTSSAFSLDLDLPTSQTLVADGVN